MQCFSGDASSPLTTPSPFPTPSAPVETTGADSYRILDESTGRILTVSESDFLPCALLCEMSSEAPDEALKAQAIAIHTTCSRMRLQNINKQYDFSCNTEKCSVYTPQEKLAEQYGDLWETTFSRIQNLCSEISSLCLYYEDELITAPYFALSAGCTQSYDTVFGGEALPYLQAITCPSDLLHSDCRAESSFTPEEIQTAFPLVSFSDDPESWFSEQQTNSAGYTDRISLCGTVFSGTQVRTALSLHSAAFTVTYDGECFIFATLGRGHGVGMSQAGAVYLAESGADHKEILSYFYSGTTLK